MTKEERQKYKELTKVLPKMHLIGTKFQSKVWQLLLKIPYGKTMTYKDIARMISPSMSAQAVGSAVGHNKISILIPCHRVIGSNNSLTGYAGGIEKKEKLLEIGKEEAWGENNQGTHFFFLDNPINCLHSLWQIKEIANQTNKQYYVEEIKWK